MTNWRLKIELSTKEAERLLVSCRHSDECEDHALATHDREPCICGADTARDKLQDQLDLIPEALR